MRKHLLALALFIFSILHLQAQVEKGSALVGVDIGSISFTNSDSKTTYSNTPTVYNSDGTSFSISINPNVAVFIKDRLAVGGGVTLSYYTSKSESSNSSSTTTSDSRSTQPAFYLGPLVRYYFGGSSKGMPFVQANIQWGISGGKSKSETSSGASSETKTIPKGDWNAGATFGYEHFFNKSIGAFASIGFNYGKSKTSYKYRPSSGSGYDYTSQYSRFNIPVNVGVQVHMNCPKKK